MVVCLILLFLLLPVLSFAVVPAPCASNVTQTPAICCPIPQGHKNSCGYPHRGRCALVTAPKASYTNSNYDNDIRMDWPARVFQYVCKCVDRYWGISCEGCRLGYEGARCQHKVVNVRRNVMNYTPRQKHQFLTVLTAAHHIDSGFVRSDRLGSKQNLRFNPTSIYENAVYTHYFAARFPIPLSKYNCKTLDLNHNTVTFILWHRYILLWWERQLRDMAREKFGWQNFTFPYWDYTDKNTCEVCTSDFICGNGMPIEKYQLPKSCQPLSSWKMYCTGNAGKIWDSCNHCTADPGKRLKRHFKKKKNVKTQLITAKEVEMALAAPKFTADLLRRYCGSFASYIEAGCPCFTDRSGGPQMHNLIHDIFGGQMQTTVGSPNDPLFFLHHSQLDRLLHRWILKVKPTASQIPLKTEKPQIGRWYNLAGFLPTVTGADMLRDLADLGIKYDNLDFGLLKEEEEVPLAKSIKQYRKELCRNTRFGKLMGLA